MTNASTAPNPFVPLAFLRGGHRQTLAGHLVRSRVGWRRPTEDVVIRAGDGVHLLLRVSWQTGSRRAHPAIVLVHGLEGCDRSAYLLSAGEMAYRSGHHVIRMNLRGCGDGIRLCARLYNAGVTADLTAVLEWMASEVPRFSVVGFSLGGNLTLLTLARHGPRLPKGLNAAVAVSPPLDLTATADALDRPQNSLYRLYFLTRLRRSYRRRQRLLPELYRPGLERGCHSLWSYDEIVTAPLAGFRDASDYYAQCSSGPRLGEIAVPTLVLASMDDPLIPVASVENWRTSNAVTRELTPTGGHVGFIGHSTAPGCFWVAERIQTFLDGWMPRQS